MFISNKIKLLLSISLFSFITIDGISQKKRVDTSKLCSNILSRLSYFWKLDSLANNGFRLYTYKEVLRSRIDEVPRAYLLEKLGNPNEIRKTNKGTQYVYYYFDIKAMPKTYDGPPVCWYIKFNYGVYDKFLFSIEQGHIDR